MVPSGTHPEEDSKYDEKFAADNLANPCWKSCQKIPMQIISEWQWQDSFSVQTFNNEIASNKRGGGGRGGGGGPPAPAPGGSGRGGRAGPPPGKGPTPKRQPPPRSGPSGSKNSGSSSAPSFMSAVGGLVTSLATSPAGISAASTVVGQVALSGFLGAPGAAVSRNKASTAFRPSRASLVGRHRHGDQNDRQ